MLTASQLAEHAKGAMLYDSLCTVAFHALLVECVDKLGSTCIRHLCMYAAPCCARLSVLPMTGYPGTIGARPSLDVTDEW